MRQPEQAEAAQPPAQFEGPVRGVAERAIPDLRAEIVEHGVDRPDVALDAVDQFLDRAIRRRVEQSARGLAAVLLDRVDQPGQPRFVGTPRQHRVVAPAGEARGRMAADPRARADYQEYPLRHARLPTAGRR